MTLSDNRQQATTTDNRTTSEVDNKRSLGGLSVSGERPVAGVSIKIKYLVRVFFAVFLCSLTMLCPQCLENVVWSTDQVPCTKYTQVHCDKLPLLGVPVAGYSSRFSGADKTSAFSKKLINPYTKVGTCILLLPFNTIKLYFSVIN